MVHRQLAFHQKAVGRNPLAAFQQHQVPHHHFFQGDEGDLSLPHHPAPQGLGFLLQTEEGRFAAVFRQGGHEGGQENGDGNAHRFKPVLFFEYKKKIEQKGGQQNFNDGIAKIAQQLLSETRPPLFGQSVGAVLLPGSLHSLGRKPPGGQGGGCCPFHVFSHLSFGRASPTPPLYGTGRKNMPLHRESKDDILVIA